MQLFHHTGKQLYIVVTIDDFYIVLFSDLGQTHCTHVAYDSMLLIVLLSIFYYPQKWGTDTVTVLFGCYMAGAT